MLKIVKLYLTPEDIKERLGDEYKGSEVLFTKSSIDYYNNLEFECLITDEENMVRNERRERLITHAQSDSENSQSFCDKCKDLERCTNERWLECPCGVDSSDED